MLFLWKYCSFVCCICQIGDKEKLGGKLSSDDKDTIETAVNDAISWLEKNHDADVEDFKAQKKQLEDVVQPVVGKLYQEAGGEQPPTEDADERDEL